MKTGRILVKTIDANGVRVIRNGIKDNPDNAVPPERKPPWLRVHLAADKGFAAMRALVKQHDLHTVCEEAMCPNISECWSHGTATIMLLGAVCTRACRFCAVDTGNPGGRVDVGEPERVAEAVALMQLVYIVLTSVNRDDLPDGGAGHYADTVKAVKRRCPEVEVEALVPDFCGAATAIECVANSGIAVFAQNIETVERLTHPVRDNRAGYQQTLTVLRDAKRANAALLTKTSLILGLGERDDEIFATMRDLREQQVDILTLGQYLRPTRNHLPVVRWVSPQTFADYRRTGLELGFTEVVAGPLVRSSYRAERVLQQANAGILLH